MFKIFICFYLKVKEFGDPIWKQQHSDKPITKRRINSKTNMSPVRKRYIIIIIILSYV